MCVSTVRPRRETSVGVWSRRPQLLRSFGTLHSGYSGRVKDSSFRARRAHDECRLSAEPLPIPPHGSILSQAPRRRSAPHRYPHRYPSIVSATARSLPRLLSATATPPCGGCNSTSAWSTTTEASGASQAQIELSCLELLLRRRIRLLLGQMQGGNHWSGRAVE